VFKSYGLPDFKENINPIKKTVLCATSSHKIFYFNDKISLLIGKLSYKTWYLNFYQLDTQNSPVSSEQIAFSRLSISESLFDLENTIPVSHKDDGIMMVGVLNDQVKATYRIVFHIFSQNVSGRNWKTTSSLLPLQHTHPAGYKIQSCIVESNYIYCSVLLHETCAYVYKFDLMLLQKHQNDNVRPVNNWHMTEPTLQNTFLSVLNKEIITLNFKKASNKTIMEVKWPINPLAVTPAEHCFELPHDIKIIKATVVLTSKIIVIFHDNKTNKCYIKTFTI